MRATWLFLPIAMGLGFAPAARTEQRFDLPTRQGATQPIYLTEAANPIASAVLYPGGTGLVSHVRNNFLIRVAGAFAATGVTAAVADAAVRLGPQSIAGVVLTSSVWAAGMAAVPVNRLRVPVLIVHNRSD
jgi:hypothetical protein